MLKFEVASFNTKTKNALARWPHSTPGKHLAKDRATGTGGNQPGKASSVWSDENPVYTTLQLILGDLLHISLNGSQRNVRKPGLGINRNTLRNHPQNNECSQGV